MQNRKLKTTATSELLTREPMVYNTPHYHDEFEKYYEITRRFLPGRYYVSAILPIIKNEFDQRLITSNHMREAFNGRRIASRYYILLATLYYLLEKRVPIPELDQFPDFFQADYLALNK